LSEYWEKLPNIPGSQAVATVTEGVFCSAELAAELVKIYPANVVDPRFRVKRVHAGTSNVEIIPTGGSGSRTAVII